MIVQLIGCSHQECALDIRERMAFSTPQIPQALAEFRQRFPEAEAVLLSTCNRTELYTAAANDRNIPSHEETTQFLAELQGMDEAAITPALFRHSGEDAIRHLFSVAASLDSMVVGEAQILSQVKQAYQVASDGLSAGQCTHAAFQSAMHVAKRVARETSLHRNRVSIPSVAIGGLARKIFETLSDKKILVLGAGKMAQETLYYLISERARFITVANRDPHRATAVASEFGGNVLGWEDRFSGLVAADLVISTTGASQPVVTLDEFATIETERFQRPLFVLDLAVPRDFEPSIGDRLGVYLYTIDDLAEICESNRRKRAEELPAAQSIIEEETRKFMQQLQNRSTGPTIRRLKESAAVIKDAELHRLMNRLDDVDDRTKDEIQQSFQRLVNKLLHPPLQSLQQEADGNQQASLVAALRRLFQLKD